jgi:hypothetical protein
MTALQQWQRQVQMEHGHKYLAGFDSFIHRLILAQDNDPHLIWQEVTKTLGDEVSSAVFSHERGFSYQRAFAKGASLKKLSDAWGKFLETTRRCGGYVVVNMDIDPHPGCPCGGPHYRFDLELSQPWCKYVSLCFECVSAIADEFVHCSLQYPCLCKNIAGHLLTPLRPLELHVGRGAFIACFYQDLDYQRISGILSRIGFEPPEKELVLAQYSSYPAEESIFFVEDAQDEVIVQHLIAGLRKSRTKEASQIMECLLRSPKAPIYERLDKSS